jgi:hypothetical protein
MEQDLRQADKDILKAMNHTLVDTPKVIFEKPVVEAEQAQATPTEAPRKPKAEPPRVENRVLMQLRETFGLEKIKRHDVMFNGMVFTLRAINASWLSWADSAALLYVVDKAGNFNRLEYEASLKIHLAAGYIEKIDGLDVTEVFGETSEKEARQKLATFLMRESSDLLGKRLYEEYDEKIEPLAKVTSGLENRTPDLSTYECTKCGNIMPYEKRDKVYFCHLDGAKLREYKLEANLPLP